MATGLLPICFGEATKISGMLLDDDKRYQVTIQLGIRTDTGDLEGRIIETKAVPELTAETLQAILDNFTGEMTRFRPCIPLLSRTAKTVRTREGRHHC